MHGIIHAELKRFLESEFGDRLWGEVVAEAGLSGADYSAAVSTYEDVEAAAVVRAASSLAGVAETRILEDFGEFIAPTLLGMYKSRIDPSWGTIDTFVNVEDTIHTLVGGTDPGAQPPKLSIERAGETHMHFHYDSPRQMAPAARGLIRGVAKHYGETAVIEEGKATGGGLDLRVSVG